MTTEQISAILSMMKTDLGIVASTTAYDERFQQIIQSAAASIAEEGATLDFDSMEDAQLVCMYASWIWRRRDSGDGMPRMLRYALNNRVLREKANG